MVTIEAFELLRPAVQRLVDEKNREPGVNDRFIVGGGPGSIRVATLIAPKGTPREELGIRIELVDGMAVMSMYEGFTFRHTRPGAERKVEIDATREPPVFRESGRVVLVDDLAREVLEQFFTRIVTR